MFVRRTAILIACGFAAALAASAPGRAGAQVDTRIVREGTWNRSLAAAQSAARYTGRPLLVFFCEDWCGYCEQVDHLLANPEIRDAVSRFILVKTSVEENETFARVHRIDLHHQIVMLDWSGNVLAKVKEFTSVKDVASTVVEAAAANDLLAGRKLLELSYYGKAAERLRAVAKVSRDKAKQDEAKKSLDDIAERAKRQLDLIRQMIRAGRTEEALDALNAFVKDFEEKSDGPRSGDKGAVAALIDEAKKMIAQLKAGKPVTMPDERPVVVVPDLNAKPTSEEEAKKLLDRGMVFEWDGNLLDALAIYQQAARQYPGTAAGAEAAKRAKTILEDDATRAALAKQQMDRVCRRLLEMGDMYEKNNRDDLALERYKAVLAAYPDSDYAAEAAKRVAEIERRHLRSAPK